MIASWSNFYRHFEYGNSHDFGNQNECIAFNELKYCSIQYHYSASSGRTVISVSPNESILNPGWNNLNDRFSGAICVPKSCSADDVREIMREVFKGSDFEQSSDYDQASYCRDSSELSEALSLSFGMK